MTEKLAVDAEGKLTIPPRVSEGRGLRPGVRSCAMKGSANRAA